jgi:multidrug resistance protein
MVPNESMINTKDIHSISTSVKEGESPVIDKKPPSSHSSSISSLEEPAGRNDKIIEYSDITGIVDPEKSLAVKPSRNADSNSLSKHTTGVSVATNATQDPAFEVDFVDVDPANPKNWSWWYRSFIIFIFSYSTMTVVLYSTSYTSGIPGMMTTFNISDETIIVLGITTYMIGLAIGSVICAPLSEMYGRRPIYLISMLAFALFVIPCALAKNLETILIVRFFGAIAGSAMIGNAPGTVNDIVMEKHRALALSMWSLGPMNGPVIGPLVGGFVYQYLGWRWTNWVVMISSIVSFVGIYLVVETYAPSILRRRAARIRQQTGDHRWFSRYDEKKSLWPLLKLNLKRPFVMTVTEPICMFWDLYIAVVYAIMYLCFVAYPIIFSEERGWAPGITGLAYVGMGSGCVIAIALEPVMRRLINSHKKDPDTGKVPPEAMVSVVCIASFCCPIGELIFAWTCTPNVHWSAPIIAGVPFGAGNCLVFIYASNYLVHSYGIYAASALAGNAVLRSIFGGTLPLAGPNMYATLGPHWAGTMLAALEAILIPIPFVFYRYGHKIREKSSLIRKMQEDKERLEGKKRRAGEKFSRTDALMAPSDSKEMEKVASIVRNKKKVLEKDIGV